MELEDFKKKLESYFGKDTFHLKFAEYYDKELFYIVSQIKDKKLETTVTKVKVYNPLTTVARPAVSCDICIGGNSANSKYIYDFDKEIKPGPNVYSLKKHLSFSLFTYCKQEQIDEVIKKHRLVFEQSVNQAREQLLTSVSFLNDLLFNSKQ